MIDVTDVAEEVWTPSTAMRVFASVVIGGLAMLALFVGFSDGRVLGAVVGVLLLVVAGVAEWAVVLRPRLVLHGLDVRVVNIVSTREFPVWQLRSATPGYSGLTLVLQDGQTVIATALPKSNLDSWTKRVTRSDLCAARLTQIAQWSRANGAAVPAVTVVAVPPTGTWRPRVLDRWGPPAMVVALSPVAAWADQSWFRASFLIVAGGLAAVTVGRTKVELTPSEVIIVRLVGRALVVPLHKIQNAELLDTGGAVMHTVDGPVPIPTYPRSASTPAVMVAAITAAAGTDSTSAI